jgi:hypothetical protein
LVATAREQLADEAWTHASLEAVLAGLCGRYRDAPLTATRLAGLAKTR